MADRYIKERTDNLFDLSTAQQELQRDVAFQGVELVPDTHHLALMNGFLHDLHSPLILGDTLSNTGKQASRHRRRAPVTSASEAAAGACVR